MGVCCDQVPKESGWLGMGKLGLSLAALVYNTYVHSVLSFLAQLAVPTPQVLEAERQTLQQIAPGPGKWAVAEDLWMLQRSFGIQADIRTIQETSIAARARLERWEALKEGGLQLARLRRDLADCCRSTQQILREVRWRAWYEGGIPQVCGDAVDALR